jgi:hypothetical protein
MSEQENEKDDTLQEVTRKVVITPEDVAGAADFWTHFDIPMPPELKVAFDNFCANPSIEAQDEVKLQITRAIHNTDHEAFKDEMFQEIVAECGQVEYDMTFDKELERTLTADQEAQLTDEKKKE